MREIWDLGGFGESKFNSDKIMQSLGDRPAKNGDVKRATDIGQKCIYRKY